MLARLDPRARQGWPKTTTPMVVIGQRKLTSQRIFKLLPLANQLL